MTVQTIAGMTPQLVMASMTCAEAATHAALQARHGFDISALVASGSSSFQIGGENFLFHRAELPFKERGGLGCPDGKPVALSIVDARRMRQIAYLHFAMNETMASATTAIRSTWFCDDIVGQSLQVFLNERNMAGIDFLNTEGDGVYSKSPALLVSDEYRGRGISFFLFGLAGFMAARVYGMETFRASAAHFGLEKNLYAHVAEKLFPAGAVKVITPSYDTISHYNALLCVGSAQPLHVPVTNFIFPLNAIDDYLAFLAIKPAKNSDLQSS